MKSILIFDFYFVNPTKLFLNLTEKKSKILSKYGHTTFILANSKSHLGDPSLKKKYKTNKSIHFIDSITYQSFVARIISIFYFLFKIIIYKNKKNFDVWYISSPDTISAFLLVLLAKFYKKKIIYEVRDVWPLSLIIFKIPQISFFFKMIEKMELFNHKNSNFILYTPSHYEIRNKEFNIKTQSFNIYGYYENFKIQKQKIIDKNLLRLVYVGYLNDVSAPYFILNALRTLEKKGYREFELNLIGYGPLYQQLKEKYKTSQLIHFISLQRETLAEEILKRSDIGIINYNNKDILRYGISPRKLFLYLKYNLFLLFNIKPNLKNPHLNNCFFKNQNRLIDFLINYIKNIKSHNLDKSKYSKYFKKNYSAENLFDPLNRELCL